MTDDTEARTHQHPDRSSTTIACTWEGRRRGRRDSQPMKKKRWPALLAGLGLSLTFLSGCQTWTSGMTLPSGRYLEHPAQYFPPSPPFPLPRELAAQERIAAEAAAAAARGDGGEVLPAPVPPAVPDGGGAAPMPLPPP